MSFDILFSVHIKIQALPQQSKSAERPKPRRYWGRWVFLILLLAIGIFVALPIVSGHSKPEGLEPQAISRFLASFWDYWAQVMRGLK